MNGRSSPASAKSKNSAINPIVVTSALELREDIDAPGNELSFITNLPSMAATALYHGKASAPSVAGFVEEARQFAIGPYAAALLKGQKLPPEERARIRGELSRVNPVLSLTRPLRLAR